MRAVLREIRDVIRASAVVEGLTPVQMLGHAVLGMTYIAGSLFMVALAIIAMGEGQ